MLGETEETITDCPHCNKKVKITQFHYDQGGATTPELTKVDE